MISNLKVKTQKQRKKKYSKPTVKIQVHHFVPLRRHSKREGEDKPQQSLYIIHGEKAFVFPLLVKKLLTTMTLTPSFSQCLLSLLSLFLVASFASETSDDILFLSSNLKFPKQQAEKLIKGLNLFPKHDINYHHGQDYKFGESRIVEKRFEFPYLGDSGASVQDLGHHAGYYRLPHTKDARYRFSMPIYKYYCCSILVLKKK